MGGCSSACLPRDLPQTFHRFALDTSSATFRRTILDRPSASIRDLLQNQADSLASIFKEIDKDASGQIDVHEWTAALQKLGLDMPGPRAERIFNASHVIVCFGGRVEGSRHFISAWK